MVVLGQAFRWHEVNTVNRLVETAGSHSMVLKPWTPLDHLQALVSSELVVRRDDFLQGCIPELLSDIVDMAKEEH